jgi:hypothetical protein
VFLVMVMTSFTVERYVVATTWNRLESMSSRCAGHSAMSSAA